MGWVLSSAYHDHGHGLLVVWVSREILDAQGQRVGLEPPRQFSWSDRDPRLYTSTGALRPKRTIIEGLKTEIRAQLQAEAETQPQPPDLEDYPGAGESI